MDYMELAIKMGEIMGLEIAISLLDFNHDAARQHIQVVLNRVMHEVEMLKEAS
jgi:hypothetical protein